jgi:CheY-like chemotaxis protein
MLVDDDADDHEIFLSALENISASVSCTTAVNGEDALEKLLTKQVTPDLIFLDINMPLMNGPQFLKEIKKHEGLKNIPVIIYSTTSAPDAIAETKELGARDFVSKPESFSQLEQILKDILSNHSGKLQ